MRGNRGVALILTIWVLLVLAIIALGVGTMARTQMLIARNQSDITSCRWAARAGIYRAIAELESTMEDQSTYLYLGEDALTLSSDDDSTVSLGSYRFTAAVDDESARINVNSASAETLTNVFDSEEIADCIVDWRDSDSTVSTSGAESEYYQGLENPYECRDGDLQTVGELRLVKGITETLLASTIGSGVELANMLTVYTQKTADDTSSQVDIQTADESALGKALGSALSQGDIRSIVNYRTRTPFTSPSQIIRVPGLSRSTIEEIYDQLKVSSATTPSGRVNINTASVEALSMLDGMDEDTAEAIIDYRAENGAFEGVGALLAVSTVTDDVFEQVAPYLTANSRVFRIVSTGRRTGTEASATITCVVDLSGTTPQIRYWQE